MNYKNLSKIFLLPLMIDSLYADEILYNNYLNISQDSSKNAIMVGATTATAKGYSAILSNPAGLSTNANIAIYTKTTQTDKNIDKTTTIGSTQFDNQISTGILYDSFALEYKLEDYVALGGAYGLESRYGLFSVGASYLFDISQRADSENSKDTLNDDEYMTGDYGTIGLMWQKSFVNEDNFYAIYIGASKKMSGKSSVDRTINISIPISPEKMSFGLGLETNIYATSVLVTFDIFKESWLSSTEVRNGTAYALKWLITEKLAIAGGISNQTNDGNSLGDIQTFGGGIEFGFSIIQLNVSFLRREIADIDGSDYLTEDSTHIDAVIVF